MEYKYSFKCCLCNKTFHGFGNNPFPLSDGINDVCCNKCNNEKVIPARIAMLYKNKGDRNERQNVDI